MKIFVPAHDLLQTYNLGGNLIKCRPQRINHGTNAGSVGHLCLGILHYDTICSIN